MSETKTYTLKQGARIRQGKTVYEGGDVVQLTEAQAKAFADKINVPYTGPDRRRRQTDGITPAPAAPATPAPPAAPPAK